MLNYKREKLLIISLIFFISFCMVPTQIRGSLNNIRGKIFNDMYANYTFRYKDVTYSSSFRYTELSSASFNVTWDVDGVRMASWIENKNTRLILNSTGPYGFKNGSHAKLWIFTNTTTINLITINGNGDYPFQIIGDYIIRLAKLGKIEVWSLENLIYTGTYISYDKTTGLLISGVFQGESARYTLQLTDTNMFSHYQQYLPEIDGFILFFSINFGIALILGLITIIKYTKFKKKVK
ncbi:MAG: hypothetical protein ACFFD1_07235 [Candidatus Thorarchaeota archaeon]